MTRVAEFNGVSSSLVAAAAEVSHIDFAMAEVTMHLRISSLVFLPNLTTQQIALFVRPHPKCSVLDLGCGVGPLAILAAKRGAREVCAIDIMEEACLLARENAKINGVEDQMSVFCGDLFNPVAERRFDLIVSDASGIAEVVARLSGWYPEGVQSGGIDGTDQTIKVLMSAKAHLNPGGSIIFPVLGLASADRIIEVANSLYGTVQEIATRWIPFNDNLLKNISALSSLKAGGYITFLQKRSRYLWQLRIFLAKA